MLILPTVLADLLMPEPNSGCWLFYGSMESRNGYGRVEWEGRRQQLHRVVYSLLVGPIPEGWILDHRCRVRWCANPEHLEPVSHAINTRRGLASLFRRAEEYLQ